MKRLVFIGFLFLLLPCIGVGQTQVFHEDFEVADSVVSSGNPVWSSNTTYQAGGLSSFRNQIALSDSSRLTTISFSTLGNGFVLLDFDQICKIQFFDNARIEVSNDNGNTWLPVTGANYLGSGQFGTINNRFCAGSYSDWQPGQDAASPNNTWWKHETFDISSLCANAVSVQIRFKLNDGNGNGPNGAYGWLLDNIEVFAAPAELIPPVITYVSPIFLNNIFSLGPFPITADITDASGIDTATVYYSVNGGPQQAVGMINTTGTIWVGSIPAVNDSDTVCYSVTAIDLSAAANSTAAPASGCRQVVALAGLTFPFFDDFETNSGLWTVQTLTGTSDWEYGTPAYQATTGAHSGVNAWDVNLTAAFGPNTHTMLISPVFDFSQAVNAKLKFWHNYFVELFFDGMYIEYTTDGNTWQVLGAVGDPNAINWYTQPTNLINGMPIWEGGSIGWMQSEYNLSLLNNVAGPVQFRFVFISDGDWQDCGYSIDDFLIFIPAAQDAEAKTLILPSATQCVAAGANPVSIAISNNGLQNIAGPVNVTYVVDNGTPVTEQYTGTLIPSQTDTFTFITPFNIAPGAHSLKVYTSLTNDGFQLNDTLTYAFAVSAPVNVPYYADFETAASINDFCVVNSQNGRVGLSALAANTGNQGVLFDALHPIGWQFFSDTIVNSPAYIWQPSRSDESRSNLQLVLNTAAANNLVLEFDARILNANPTAYDDQSSFRVLVNGVMISPHIQYSTNGGIYTFYRYDLSSFLPATTLVIDFEAKVYYSIANNYGVLLDNVNIYEPDPIDVQMVSIIQPLSQQPIGTQASVQVLLRNTGQNTLTSIPLSYQAGASVPVSQVWTGSLAANAVTTFTFAAPFTVVAGQVPLCAWAALPNDTNNGNDTSCMNIVGVPMLAVPFADNFDGASTFFAAENTYTPSWELGTPAPPHITNAHSAPNAWEINLNGPYRSNSEEYLYSPFFDFSLANNIELRFWHMYYTDYTLAGGFVEYTIDGGNSWQQLGVLNDQQGVFWYGTPAIWPVNKPGWSGPGFAYVQSRYNLSFLNGSPNPVRFRFVFSSSSAPPSASVDGWAVDDFELISTVGIEEQTPADVQLSSYPNPASQTAVISYSVPREGVVTLTLRDVMGREIISETTEVNTSTQLWNVDVSTLPDGVYFYELIYNDIRSVQRLVVNH